MIYFFNKGNTYEDYLKEHIKNLMILKNHILVQIMKKNN